MSQYLLPLGLLAAGAVLGLARRWIPKSGLVALALCALPIFGFWLASLYC